jgi:hypothetical protein
VRFRTRYGAPLFLRRNALRLLRPTGPAREMAYAKTLARVVKRMDGLGSAPYQFRFFM